MVHRLFFLLLFTIYFTGSYCQLKSPEQFLGYPVGTQFTPHWKIAAYFRHVAASAANKMILQQYGETYEGRPLLAAFISSAENKSRLESIRENNLRLSGIVSGKGRTENTPAIVWLSYNVHGNETSSSEAAMLTLYKLVEATDDKIKQWLQKTVVIIDPCLNPDGRDRYVNWFHSVSGSNFNVNPDAREHHEPWPGGRTNHYNFDLNRDWAWQTQRETQQRMKLYHNWLPQVHVDFHEQSINAPYYFAPAAEPFHEVITPWQKNFQEVIGRNHARYFDEKSWLYFTKEVFDLLYPSYGDTYPTYNGAIGMTYEQGGGPAGGLGVLINNADTLTLQDRVLHHVTTSLSTIETAATHAQKLLNEFALFFQKASENGVGDYKSYVVKYSDRDADRINTLKNLLNQNGIRFGSGSASKLRGFNYNTGQDEGFNVSEADLIISAQQPKGNLVKVLFEPNTAVADSNTYDITAWALPYVFGLDAYAAKQSLSYKNTAGDSVLINKSLNPYGYIIRWNGISSVRLVTQLLQQGIRLRFSEVPFVAGGQKFERGSVIILKTSNQYQPDLWRKVEQLANNYQVRLHAVSSGFVDSGADFGSSRIHSLSAPKVALLTGEGVNAYAAGEVWFLFDQELNYPVTLINQNALDRISLEKYDVLILPDGEYQLFKDKSVSDQIHNWITNGGNLVAMGSAVTHLARFNDGILQKKAADSFAYRNGYSLLRKYENRDREQVSFLNTGSIYKVELDNTHPLAFGYPAYYYTLKQDQLLFDFLQDGWNVGVLKKNRQVAGFVGSKLKTQLQDGLLFGVVDEGNGTITILSDNVLFRNFWENGKLLFCNAIFMVGQ